MRSTVEPLEGNKVKVSVEVDETEFEDEVDAAFRRLAQEVRIPGFRPGRVPRRILEARVGNAPARADALQHALPEYYAQAVREHDVDVIAAPDIDITDGEETGPITFDAVVEVRPHITIGGYESLRVTITRPDVTDDEIDARVDQLREQFAELNTVDRPAHDGDNVSIDVSGRQGDEELGGLTAQDYLYEVGSGSVVPEMDVELRGAKAGDILQFEADHPDPEEDRVIFRILVKDVREKILPEPDDEWADEASEFATLAELRADFEQRLTVVKRTRANMEVQERAGEALAELVTDDVPDALISAEMQTRLQDLAMRLQAQGLELEQYLAATGQEQETFVAGLRQTAEQATRVDLALRAVADAEGVEADEKEVDAELSLVAERVGQSLDQVRADFERNEQMPAVRSDVRKRKALEWLLEHVEIVDEAGEAIDRAALEIEPTDDTDQDDTDPDDSDDIDENDEEAATE